MLMNNNYQKHILKLIILIKEVTLTADNGSNLTFQIKTDSQTIELADRKYMVEDNRCIVNDRAAASITAIFDKKLEYYVESQTSIFIKLWLHGEQSAHGYVRYNPFSYGLQEKQVQMSISASLKGAMLRFTTKLEVIKKSVAMLSPAQTKRYDQVIRLSRNTSKSSVKSPQKSFVKQIQPEAKKQLKPDDYMLDLRNKKEQKSEKQKPTVNRMDNIKVIKSDPKVVVKSPKIIESKVQNANFDYKMQRIKRRLDQERQEKVRSISKLKMEASPKIKSGEPVHQETEASKLKDKIRCLQRKEKHYLVNIEDLGRSLEKKKFKQVQLQKMKAQMERVISQKDIKIRSAQATIRNLHEQIDSLSSKQRIVSRKGEVRQTAQKEQYRKLEERLRQSEIQIASLTSQKNSQIKEILQLEKKHQQSLKERDFKLNEQKSKVFKLRQEMISIQKEFQLKLQQENEKYQNLCKISTAHQEKTQELLKTIFTFENQIAELKDSLRKQKEAIINLESAKDRKEGEQLMFEKKKYHELSSQHMILKQTNRKMANEANEKLQRIKGLEESLKYKSTESQKYLIRINNLERQLDTVREEVNRKNIQAQYMRNTITSLNDKIIVLKQKVQAQKNRKEEANQQLQKQLAISNKQRELYQSQISDYKWGQLKYNDRITQLELKIKDMNNDIMRYNQQLMAKDQRIMSLEDNDKIVTFQHERISNELQNYQVRLRENINNLKTKHVELEQEKRLRLRAEKQYEQQRKKNERYQQTRKSREQQQQMKLQQSANEGKNRVQQLQNIEMELFNKKQQLLTLKTTVELTLREAELAKSDYQNVKGQLNLLRVQMSNDKGQREELLIKVQDLSSQLATANESLSTLGKKADTLKNYHDEYREAVERSLSNLASQFYKDEENLNIVATTLIPFPDEKLSSIQIEMVQKRNAFIVKQRQLLADQKQQIVTLEEQMAEMKGGFNLREEELNRRYTQEVQRLKGLMYEGMLQKNTLVEQLNVCNSEKEELFREYERQKRQIIQNEEIEQELNGQLQLLLSQHEQLKNQNQQLASAIFRLKEEEIKVKSIYDCKIIQMEEDRTRSITKLKQELIQKENKIISLQKSKTETEEIIRGIEQAKSNLQKSWEQVSDSLRKAQDKISQQGQQTTTLNNMIKNQEKIQAQNKLLIDRLEVQIKQLNFKEEAKNNSLANIHSQLTECCIEKEKLNSQVIHLRQRLEQLNIIYSQKGEISRQKIENKIEQNSKLKSKNIEQASELSMKEFYLSQRDQQINKIQQEKEDLKQQIATLKAKLKGATVTNDELEDQNKQSLRRIKEQEHQLKRYEDLLTKGNGAIIMLQEELCSMKVLEQSLKQKQKECFKLRAQNSELEKRSIDQNKKYQETINSYRKQVESQRQYQTRLKEQHKNKLERSESMNHEKYNILVFQFEKERQEFAKRVQQIEQHNRGVVSGIEARVEVMKYEIDDLRDSYKSAQEEIYKKQAQIDSLHKKLQESQRAMEQYRQKQNKYYLLYQQLKSQKNSILQETQEKLSKSIEESKSSQIRLLNRNLTEIQRKISKLKVNEPLQVRKDELSRREVLNIIDHIFSKIGNIINSQELKEESDSFEVYRQKKSYHC